jgi:hypothetical protein
MSKEVVQRDEVVSFLLDVFPVVIYQTGLSVKL